jgi:hypothetical protein
MNLFEPGFSGNWSCGVLVKWSEMSSKLQLFVDVDFLVAKNW